AATRSLRSGARGNKALRSEDSASRLTDELSLHLANPITDELGGLLINDVRRDVRHLSQAALLHPLPDQRPLGIARHQQARILQVERALSRLDVDRARLVQFQRRQQ